MTAGASLDPSVVVNNFATLVIGIFAFIVSVALLRHPAGVLSIFL